MATIAASAPSLRPPWLRPPWLRPRDGLTVRARLVLLYSVVSALVGIVPVGLMCVLIEHDLGSVVESALSQASTTIPAAPLNRSEYQQSGRTSPNSTWTVPASGGLTVVLAVLCPHSGATQSAPPAAATSGPTDVTCKLASGAPRSIAVRAASAEQIDRNISSRLVRQMLLYSALALGVLVVLAFALGWWVAGRALRPVHRMAAAAHRLSSANLHERIPLHRPKDELRELGESFNALLDRLAAAFAAQRRFVANAAHELRTPLAIQRATIQIGLGEPDIEPAELAGIRDELLTTNRRHEQLIDRLLLLARGEAGLEHREPVDLADIVLDTVDLVADEAQARSVVLDTRTEALSADGDPVLLGQLVTNLAQNAIRHNRPGGRVEIRTDAGELTVRNTGPVIAEDVVAGLFEPFRRLDRDRTGSGSGTGLGLSIVRSIVTAHGGEVTASPNQVDGGLTVTVRLPEPDRAGPDRGRLMGPSHIT